MRVLGGWIALTPEVDVKLLFGRHVWDCAQHADLWGRRLPELRAAAQQSEPANAGVVAAWSLIETAEGKDQTLERVTAIYRVLKPHLATVYERHLAVANPVYEPPPPARSSSTGCWPATAPWPSGRARGSDGSSTR